MPALLGLLTVILVFYGLRKLTVIPPNVLARLVKKAGAVLTVGAGTLLALRGLWGPGLLVVSFGLWKLGFRQGPFAAFRSILRNKPGVARVRSAMIEMELDRITGAIDGLVLAGSDEGKRLSALSGERLLRLRQLCLTDDPEGARLLEAYLDRRFPGWRDAGQGQRDARGTNAGGSVKSRRPSAISEDEAYEILGLKKGAPVDEITRAHRDLMKKLHPDRGGSADLAARVNEAKEVLMRRYHG